MNRIQLAKVISEKYFPILSLIEPDVLNLIQNNWKEGLALFGTNTSDEFYSCLVEGPWSTQEMKQFDSDMNDYQKLINEIV
jgi:hypothetical protein